jgi:hypothetical protein
VGTFISSVDFTLPRDADIEMLNNVGYPSVAPSSKINVEGNALATTITTGGTYYKLNFINGVSSSTRKFTLADNKITFQSSHPKEMAFTASGSISASGNNRTIRVAIKKNNDTLYSPMTVRCPTSGQPNNFTLITKVDSVVAGDYFELFATTISGGVVVTLLDLNWYGTAEI